MYIKCLMRRNHRGLFVRGWERRTSWYRIPFSFVTNLLCTIRPNFTSPNFKVKLILNVSIKKQATRIITKNYI